MKNMAFYELASNTNIESPLCHPLATLLRHAELGCCFVIRVVCHCSYTSRQASFEERPPISVQLFRPVVHAAPRTIQNIVRRAGEYARQSAVCVPRPRYGIETNTSGCPAWCCPAWSLANVRRVFMVAL